MKLATLALLLFTLVPQEDDTQLRQRLEKLSVEDLARLYYIEWGRCASLELEDEILEARKQPGSESKIRAMEEAAAATRETYSKHEDAKPLQTVERLLRSKNRQVSKLGFKVLTKGGFSEAIEILKEVDPAKVEDARRILKLRRAPFASTQSPEALQPIKVAKVKAALKEIRDEDVRQPYQNLKADTNVYFGEDLAAWEAWLKKNEPYLACEPRLCEGLVYVDEEAKACGVPWLEWQKLSATQQAEKLKSKSVPKEWKRVDLMIEVDEARRLVRGVEIDGTGSGFDPTSKSMAYWIYLQKKRLGEWAPEWDLKIYIVHGTKKDSALRVRERCKILGFPATLVPEE